MKDTKIQNVRPIAEPRPAGKTGRKEKVAGKSFHETLNTTISRMNDLKHQADASLNVKEAKAASIKEEINSAKDIYDKMMREKQNLSQLYYRIKNKEES